MYGFEVLLAKEMIVAQLVNTAADVAERPDVLDCIKRARQDARDDDVEFIRLLNECYVTKRSTTRGGIAIRAAATDRTPKAKQILSDPRFLANARELASRTQGGERVIGGRPVAKGQFLDCVAVGNNHQWGCTGTLTAPDVVVTAGHCAAFATRVFFGNDVTKQGKIVSVKKFVPHPEYTAGKSRSDLMVLLLEERVENIASRPLAKTEEIDAATDGRVVGFGNTDPMGSFGYGIKRQVDVPIASVACMGNLDGQTDAAAYGCMANLEIVAGKPLLKKDSCTGDSGGPFYVESSPGKWAIAGATSRATNSGPNDCGDGGIYVRLDRYRDWIASIPGVTLP